MGFSYSADNDRRFRLALDRAKAVTTDLRVPLALIAKDFYKSEKAIFQLQGPGQYPDLAKSTKIEKLAKKFPLYPILRRTGKLEEAATVQGGRGNITDFVGTDKLEMGVSNAVVPYAIFHQSNAARKRIPLRKFIFIGPEAKQFATSDQVGRLERWLNIMNSFVLQKMKQQGFPVGGTS